MNSKRAAAKVEPQGVSESVGDVTELPPDELAVMANEVDVENRLREWAERENPERLETKSYIYKYENPTSGDLKVLVDRLDNEIPDPHQVGLAYGSGRYIVMVAIPRGQNQTNNVKALRFRLHTRYDDLKKAAAATMGGAAVPVPGVAAAAPAGSSLKDGVDMVRSVVEMLAPLMAAKQAPSMPDVGRILETQLENGQRMIARSLENSQSLVTELQRARLENEGGGEVNEEPDFMARIMPMVEQFLPLLLGGGAGAKATAAAIRAAPQVQQVIGNAHDLARVVAWLDKTHGKDRADKVLAALKVRRPGVNGRAHTSAPALRLAAAGGGRG